jgi:hypothetical protein
MPRLRFESTIPVFEKAKTVHALGAHIRTSLARESDSARVPMSQTRSCVGRQAHTCVVKLMRARLLAEPDSQARLVRVLAALDRAATVIGSPATLPSLY